MVASESHFNHIFDEHQTPLLGVLSLIHITLDLPIIFVSIHCV